MKLNSKLQVVALVSVLQSLTVLGFSPAEAQTLLDRATSSHSTVACDDYTDCKTVAGAVAVSGASTAVAMKKYKQAKAIEKVNTAVLGEWSEGNQPDSFRTQSLVGSVADGDKVVVQYQLSFKENRQYHIDLYEQKSVDAESSADFHSRQAIAAAIPKPVTHVDEVRDSNGNVVSRNIRTTYEVDHAGVIFHTSQASSYRENALNYRREADAVRSGQKQAPMYTHDKSIEDAAGNRTKAAEFVNERVGRDGKILKITRLPAAAFKQVRSAIRIARGGVGGAVAFGLVAAEEAVVGAGAEKVDQLTGSSGWSPSARNSRTAR
jgi:hypothetical protein